MSVLGLIVGIATGISCGMHISQGFTDFGKGIRWLGVVQIAIGMCVGMAPGLIGQVTQ